MFCFLFLHLSLLYVLPHIKSHCLRSMAVLQNNPSAGCSLSCPCHAIEGKEEIELVAGQSDPEI